MDTVRGLSLHGLRVQGLISLNTANNPTTASLYRHEDMPERSLLPTLFPGDPSKLGQRLFTTSSFVINP